MFLIMFLKKKNFFFWINFFCNRENDPFVFFFNYFFFFLEIQHVFFVKENDWGYSPFLPYKVTSFL
jgi:hypothetical protein